MKSARCSLFFGSPYATVEKSGNAALLAHLAWLSAVSSHSREGRRAAQF